MEMKQPVQVLWTGGMDSTLVMVQLSQNENVKVLPVYISHANYRKTEGIELSTMNAIYTELKKDPRTKAELLPIRIVAGSIDKIPAEAKEFEFEFYQRRKDHDRVSMDAQRNVDKKIVALQGNRAPGGIGNWPTNLYRFPQQYARTSSYAKGETADVEICINGHESFFQFPIKHKITEQSVDGRIRYVLDKEETDPDLYEVFKNISFPLYHITKVETFNMYSRMGYEHIRKMIWHCYDPIDGKPCGQCITCTGYIREGIYDVFDRDALIRYIKFSEKERELLNKQYQEMLENKK